MRNGYKILVSEPSKHHGDKGVNIRITLKLASQEKAINASDMYQ
jgi:hypothetical protein